VLLAYSSGLALGGAAFVFWVLLATFRSGCRSGFRAEEGAKSLVPILLAAAGWLLAPAEQPGGFAEGLVELRTRVLDGPWTVSRYGVPEHRYLVSGRPLQKKPIQIRSQGLPEPRVSAGDRIRLQGWHRAKGKRSWMETRGELIGHQGEAPFLFLHREIYNARRALWDGLRQSLSRRAASLNAAMLLGLPAMVDPSLGDLFRETGCAHLLAISGLHMAMIYLMAYSILIRIGLREKQIFWPLLLLLLGYSLLTGCRIPVFRAYLVCAFHLCAARIRRQIDPFEVLFHVCLILLLIEPCALFEISFQLSFAGYSAILVFLKLHRKAKETWSDLEVKGAWRPAFPFERLVRKALFFLGISTASWLGTMPLTWHYFECFIPWAPINNLVIFPFFMAALMVSSVHLFALLFGLHLSLVTTWPVELGIEALTDVLGLCRKIPPGALDADSLPACAVWGIHALLSVALFLVLRFPAWRAGRRGREKRINPT
jgi:ComEC/Rec2-related protein